MNVILHNDNKYRVEGYWRNSEKSTKKDYNNKLFPYPVPHKKKWLMQEEFLVKLNDLETYLRRKNKYIKHKKPKDCVLCSHKAVERGYFIMNKVMWPDSLFHYINKHNIKPSESFTDIVFRFQYPTNKVTMERIFDGQVYVIRKRRYLKLSRNQIGIMDALMEHGGTSKKYVDNVDTDKFRYSEHAGVLDFNKDILEKVIISGKTTLVDKYDDEIFLPNNLDAFFDYEYIFHTHPPTPNPGSRVKYGILYEFPSINDVLHFIDHYNDGTTQGSIVMAPEGMYVIRRKSSKNTRLKFNEETFISNAMDLIEEIQDEYINIYGTKISRKVFYEKVASDHDPINRVNKFMNKYDIHIDYFHRQKDKCGNWVIETVYLPIAVSEKKK